MMRRVIPAGRFDTRPTASTPHRFLSAEECRSLFARMRRMCHGGGDLQLNIDSRQIGYVRWARNEIVTGGEVVAHALYIVRRRSGIWGFAMLDRLDEEALQDGIRRAERQISQEAPNSGAAADVLGGAQEYLQPALWSDATFAVDAAARAAAQVTLVRPAVEAGLLSSGFLQVSAIGHGVINTAGLFAYLSETQAQCSLTVRNAKGTASGWAGKIHRDWSALDPVQLAARAVDKCKRSADPVAIEPGRYTVILEPQAAADLVAPMVQGLRTRDSLEAMGTSGAWFSHREPPARREGVGAVPVDSLGYKLMDSNGGFTNIGRPVLDSRVTITTDPTDADMPSVPFSLDGNPGRPATWVERGILRNIGYMRNGYARRELRQSTGLNNNIAFRMAPGPTSVAEMIASTERGLLVTRFVNIRPSPTLDLLLQGNTSDGLWLIEKGKISGPVKNFRFRESPVFSLNNLEAVGPAERVFMDPPVIMPALKVKDFSMTSLADAV